MEIKEDYNNCVEKINQYEIELANSKDSIEEIRNKVSQLEEEKEGLSNKNNTLVEEAKSFQSKLFELQAKVIDAEVELAKAKKEQLGPVVLKRKNIFE